MVYAVYACLTFHLPGFSVNVTEAVFCLKKAHQPVIHHLYSIHPNLYLLSYLLNVLLQNVCSVRVKSVWIPAGAPVPSSRCMPHVIGTRYMSIRVLSVFLFPPSRRVGTTQPSWPACSVQEQTPQPKISSCFHSPLPLLTSHIFQEALFGWTPG